MKDSTEKEHQQYFIENLLLRWEHKEEILNDPLYFHIPYPTGFTLGLLGKKSTLGLLFRAWKQKTEAYNRFCSCGKNGMIFSFVGNLLTGTCSWQAICLDCKNVFTGKDSSHSQLTLRADILDNQPVLE